MNDDGRGRNARSKRRKSEGGKKESSDELRGLVITQIANRGGSDDKRLLESTTVIISFKFII